MRTSHWLQWTLLCATLIASVGFYAHLPDQMANRWNFAGEIISYADKRLMAFFPPALILATMFVHGFAYRNDPKRGGRPHDETRYRFMGVLAAVVLTVFHALMLAANLGVDIDFPTIGLLAVGAFALLYGNAMPTFKPSYFLGVRTPWTLADDRVWSKTHWFGGKLVCLAGLLLMATAFLDGAVRGWLFMGLLAVCVLGIWLYSYLAHRRNRESDKS